MTDALRRQLRLAATHAQNPETRKHLGRALRELNAPMPDGLAECPHCGRVGIPERIATGLCCDL